jgi:hypothetical protein
LAPHYFGSEIEVEKECNFEFEWIEGIQKITAKKWKKLLESVSEFRTSGTKLFEGNTQCAINAHKIDRATYNSKEVTGHVESIYD